MLEFPSPGSQHPRHARPAPRVLLPLLMFVLAGGGAACGFVEVRAPRPPRHANLSGLAVVGAKTRTRNKQPDHNGPLTLREALRWALNHHPELAVAARDQRVAKAQARSANRYPNPQLHVDVEDWLGSGDVRGVRTLQLTITLSQDVELGRKRAARLQLARIEQRTVAWDFAQKRVAVLARTTQAFVNVLYEQQRLALTRQQARLAQRFFETVQKRHAAGKFKPGALANAKVRRELARVDVERARRELRGARLVLAAQWGATEPRYSKVVGQLRRLPVLPGLDSLLAAVTAHPAAKRLKAQVAQRRAQLVVARSLAFPDLSLRAGYRWLEGSRDSAFVVGLSIPLPFFSRNVGAIAAAQQRIARSRLVQRAHVLRMKLTIKRTYERLQSAIFEAKMLRSKVLPTSRSSCDKLREAYQLGRVDYLAVLEAQRTCFSVQARYLRALLRLHRAAITLQRIASPWGGTQSRGGRQPTPPRNTK